MFNEINADNVENFLVLLGWCREGDEFDMNAPDEADEADVEPPAGPAESAAPVVSAEPPAEPPAGPAESAAPGVSRADALVAWDNIKSNTWKDEKRHYEEEYEVADDASDIETTALEDSQYKDMRKLDDYLFAEVNLIFIITTLTCSCV
jgi:hypothetical protein